MITEKKEYQTSYGLLRILACIMVIIHHFDGTIQDISSQKVMAIVDNLTMVNNGLFFMMSGKFALEYFSGNVLVYYRKRFGKIVVPYLIINCIISLMNGYTLTEYISRVRHGEVYDWFVYAVIGFYLVAPFFYYMFYDMKEKYKILFLLSIYIYVGMNSVNECSGVMFYTASNPFFDTLSFFLLGYLVDHIELLRKYKWQLVGIGVCAACISTYEAVYMPGLNSSLYGLCITRICMCVSVYVLVCWKDYRIKENKKRRDVIKYMANLTYYVYLIHTAIQNQYAIYHAYILSKNPYVRLVFGSLEVILGSFLFACLYDSSIKIIRNLGRRILYHSRVCRK